MSDGPKSRLPYPLRYAVVATAVLFAAGCQVDQRKEVAQYRSILDRNVAPAPPLHDGETLTLARAMALASQADEGLAARGEDYVQALIARNRALANFLPTVSFQPSFVVAQPSNGTAAGATTGGNTAALGPISTGFSTSSVLGTASSLDLVSASAGTGQFRRTGGVVTRLEAPVVGSINVFRGFGDVANLDVAKLDINQRRELMLDLQDTVLLNVAQGYYQVLRSQAQADVLRNSLAVQEARVKLVRDQFAQKLATRLAVAQSEAQADATRVTLLQAESDVRNGRVTLAYLIGAGAITGPLADDFTPPPAATQSAGAYVDAALRDRRDYVAARFNTRAARRAVDVYVAQYYPSVSLNVAGFLYREFLSDASKWDAILSANLPIFSAGLIEADVRAAWSRLRQAALAEQATRRAIVRDVEVAYENLATAERKITELEGEVEAAEEALRQSKSAYVNGLAINLDVLVAQDQLLNAQLQLTGVRYDRVVFHLELLRTAGELNPRVLVSPSASTQPAPPDGTPNGER